MAKENVEFVQTFGKKKNAVAVALCKRGKGTLRVNGKPIDLVEPQIMRTKLLEPILLLGHEKFAQFDIRVRVRGGGYVAQIYAIRMAICKGIIAFHQKFIDEQSKREMKELLLEYDRNLLVADLRRMEPKHVGGSGARAKKQKSYR
jgi:small subunit ribosomal protein S16e